MYRLIVAVMLAFLLVLSAGATTVNLNYIGAGSNTSGNYYVYPYYFSVNGSTTNTPLLCDAFGNEITAGQSWTATANTFSSLSGTMFNSLSNSGTLYKEAGWLFLQLGPNPSASTAAGINWAIWGLFDSALVCTNGNCTGNALSYYNSGAATWAANALTAVNATGSAALPANYFSNLTIYTPTGGAPGVGPQELIGGGPVPEPSTIILIGTGLLGVGAYARRLRHTQRVNASKE